MESDDIGSSKTSSSGSGPANMASAANHPTVTVTQTIQQTNDMESDSMVSGTLRLRLTKAPTKSSRRV
jgi:hypothetical protein